MTKHLCLSVLAAVISLAVAAPAYPIKADETKPVTTSKKKHKRHHVAKRNYSPAYPGLEPFRSSDFVGQFPGSCAYDRAAGNCMIDLGYGRCEPCSIAGGGRR